MDIKYYDLLSTTIIGVAIVAIVNYLFLGNIDVDGLVYLALGYLTGYFINALGSILEGIYYWVIGGRPSDNLLKVVNGQNWTGYKRVKFYEPERVIERLKNELGDPDASVGKMFACAMRKVNPCEDCRVPAFNAQYAFSRTILTTLLIADSLCIFRFYDNYVFYLIAVPLFLISLRRFKERGYYYAREVLNEYLKRTDCQVAKE